MVLLTLFLCLIDGWIVLNVIYSNILYRCVLFGAYCITWQVIQFTLLHNGHLNKLTSSSKIVQPAQSGVLQWKVFFILASASFIAFSWSFSRTAGVTNWKNNFLWIQKSFKFVYLQEFTKILTQNALLRVNCMLIVLLSHRFNFSL